MYLGIHLMARQVPSLRCSARYTVLVEPLPSVRISRYLPDRIVCVMRIAPFGRVSSASHAYVYSKGKCKATTFLFFCEIYTKVIWKNWVKEV